MRKVFLYPLLILFAIVIVLTFRYYHYVFKPNVGLQGRSHTFLLIPTGAGFRTVCDSLYKNGFIKDRVSFEWTARRKGYPDKIRPGRYRIDDRMSNNELINLLRSGRQEPVRLRFQSARTAAELAGKVARQIEADSSSLKTLMEDKDFVRGFNVSPVSIFTILIPNTYEFYWNTSARQFLNRMHRESRKFWQGERERKAKDIGLTSDEVVVLASIIEKETAQDAERSTLAGIYMNRLKKGWPLQADPTLIFAWNDYTIKRVLNRHKEINSPYNTYKHTGLPPGPICLPSVASIDGVLNYKKHDYLYFCAKDDFSGYHHYSKTLPEHQIYAARYQRALSKLLKQQNQ